MSLSRLLGGVIAEMVIAAVADAPGAYPKLLRAKKTNTFNRGAIPQGDAMSILTFEFGQIQHMSNGNCGC